MNKYKKIALCGRPNVGKSALFNAIIKKRIAIVDDAEGTTRDRLVATSDLFGYPFTVIDTGGIDLHSKQTFAEKVTEQALYAVEEADAIIFVVDGTCGVHELDVAISKILHRTQKPIVLAVNKIDSREMMDVIYDFQSLGIPNLCAVSASHGFQIAELIEQATKTFDKSIVPTEQDTRTRIAICGRPNVGKSLLFNTLLGHERSIVSPIAGTTRDAVDTEIVINNISYLFIDTAGFRRKHKEKEVVEKFASIRSLSAVERADIILLVTDASSGITTEEKKLLTTVEENGKAAIVLLNKYDLVKGFRMEHCFKGLSEENPFIEHLPRFFISAKTGRNLDKIFPAVETVHQAYTQRITTGRLNKFLTKAMQECHPTMIQGRRLRIYYMTQTETAPPRFVLFVNSPELMDSAYKKYLINGLREAFGFAGCPIELTIKGKLTKKRLLPPHIQHKDRDLAFVSTDTDEE